MGSKTSRQTKITWLKIVLVIVVIGFAKYSYDQLASEGNPLTTLLFKVRAPYLDPGYLKKVSPTSFRMIRSTDTLNIDTDTESFSVDYSETYPQLEYYGEVLSRSELNRLIQDNFKAVQERTWNEFKKDAMGRLESKELIPGFGRQEATMEIEGEVAYFSRSIVSIRYKIKWSYGGKKELFPIKRVSGFTADIALSRALQLRDVLSYPYQDFVGRLWDRARFDLEDRHLDVSQFHLYHDTPEFYISPSGLVLVNLSTHPDYGDVEVRIPFRENKTLFRSDGPISNLATPHPQ